MINVLKLQNFVDGKFVEAVDGQTSTLINPANEQTLATVPHGAEADVERAVRAARKAFEGSWIDTTPAERANLLLELASRIEADKPRLSKYESLNVGKPNGMAHDEIDLCVDHLKFFAGAARILEGKSAGEYLKGYTSMIRREPIGVIGQVVPWNYPLMMAMWKIAPALAAGNTVVLKPSELTPVTALLMAEHVADLFPAGVLNIVTGNGVPVGSAMSSHSDIDMVAFTGSGRAGQNLAENASHSFKRVHLELGGKAPVVVFDDADIPALVEVLKTMAFWNSGQECGTPCRVLASSGVYTKLLDQLAPAVESIKVGDPEKIPDVAMGPVISHAQQERVMGFIQRARNANILVGDRELSSNPGFFVKPTLITDVNQDDEIIQSEVFGPVVTVQKFTSESEALNWANDVSYGLAASVWTRDVARAHSAIRKLHFGTVWINDHGPFISEMPWGGFKASGYGKDLSTYSLEDYTQIKHAMIKFE